MDRGSILSGGAFRAAVYATLIFLAVSLAVAVAGYRFIQSSQLQALREEAGVIIEMLSRVLEDDGDAAFLSQANRMSWRPDLGPRFVSVFDGEWKEIAASLDPSTLPEEDWSIISVVDDSGRPREFYVLRTRIDNYPVVVGVDLSIVNHTESVFMRTLLGIAIAMTITFIVLGYVASRTAQHKLDAVGVTLDKVADGDTTIRIPVHATNDQIDRIGAQINGHLDRLSALQTARTNSAAAIAHDLKRPVARASMMVEDALARSRDGVVPVGVVEELHAQLMRLGQIFDSIMRITRIDAERGERLHEEVSLSELVQDMGETYQAVAEDAGQHLTFDPGPDGLSVPGDTGMLMQMVSNLLQNAIVYGRAGNRIALSARASGPGAVLQVSDTGPGIPDDELELVLRPFARGDAARTTEGNGLGLALVQAVADRHGAELTLSDARPGLCVTVRFPAADRG